MKDEFTYDLQSLFWESTLRCNAYCEFCGSKCGDYSIDELIDSEIDEETICKCWKDISESFEPQKIMINVTGGEPLLRKDLFPIMTYASKLGFPWGLVTNGVLIDEVVIEKMRNSGMRTISISLDGMADRHNEMRRIPNGFEKVKQAVVLLKKASFLDEIQITTVVNHKNICDLEEMFDELITWGIDSWRLATVDPVGRAKDRGDLLLSDEDYREYLLFFDRHLFNGVFTLITSCSHYLGSCDNLYRPHRFTCKTGQTIGSILANGDIYVCPNVPRITDLIQGNIKNDSFTDVWKKKYEWFRKKDRLKNEKCTLCEHYENCQGDSLHTWDFSRKTPQVCYNERFLKLNVENHSQEEYVKQKLLESYTKMKGIRILYDNSSQSKVIFTPSATLELLTYFGWGDTSPWNSFELLVGLIGCNLEQLIVVEHIIPGNLENRSETTALFSKKNYEEIIKELNVINQATGNVNNKYKLTDSYRLVGIAHSHPQDLTVALSMPDIQLHGDMLRKHSQFVSVLLNPQKREIAAYNNSVFTPIDIELLMPDENDIKHLFGYQGT